MSEPSETSKNSHSKWLRRAAEEMTGFGAHAWANTCKDAADEIDRLERQLSAERAKGLEEACAAVRGLLVNGNVSDALQERIRVLAASPPNSTEGATHE